MDGSGEEPPQELQLSQAVPGEPEADQNTPFKAAGPAEPLELSQAVAGEEGEEGEEGVAAGGERGEGGESLGPSHPTWTTREKHAFILTKAAKLLYSRYGDVQGDLGLVSLSALFTAIVSRVAELNDSIRCITTETHKFVFMTKGEFYIIIIAKTTESEQLLAAQCSYLYTQLISLLTGGVNNELKKRANRDLYHLVAGTEKYFDALVTAMDREPEFLLNAVHCLKLEPEVRNNIGSILNVKEVPELFYAVLIAKGRLINVVRPKAHALFPADLHLIFNFVRASGGLRSSESWTPICLPNFNDSGYLHAHIAFVDQNDVCLLLISTHGTQQAFYALQQCSKSIQSELDASGALREIQTSLNEGEYVLPSIGVPNLLHFLYKSNSTSQFTRPAWTAPYNTEEEQMRLFRLYQLVHQKARILPTPMNIFLYTTDSESILCWTCAGFELFATFGPLVSKGDAIKACNSLLTWVKQEESRLFILSSPVRD